jgi:hypothetical protein
MALALLILAGVVALRYGSGLAARTSIPQLPGTMLWAWERPEDLRFLDTKQVGVAFLAGTVRLRAEAIHVRPRLQPLRLKPGTALMAVVRIEPDAEAPPALSSIQRTQTAAAIVELATRPGIAAVQVDYDAPASQREFYAALLRDVRARLPGGTPLSITALASWCLGDNWIDGLPVEEAVPMLFQMGADSMAVRRHLAEGRDFNAPLCRGSLGLATDEPLKQVPGGRRVYLFHARPWTAESARLAAREAKP